jgi:glycosyltransferase involved in cell wall biosynthesis
VTLAILIPVLRRPHRVVPLLESIKAATPEPHRVLFIASPNDQAEIDAISAAGGEVLVIDDVPAPGDYARKINAGYRHTDEPLLFLGADDIHFHPGWLPAARALLERGVHVVGTNDLGNSEVIAGRHATHSLVTRQYIDVLGTLERCGEVLHEGYAHEYVDNEFVQTAIARQAWANARDSIVEHLHPHWGKAPTDELYDQHHERMRTGRRVFMQRQPLIRNEARKHRAPALLRPSSDVTVITASMPSRHQLLVEALAAVAAQTVPCAHLVGVDQGHGVADVRTQLVEAARTEWVAFLDDDDLIDPDHLETLLAHAGDADVVIPHCRFDGPPLPAGYYNRPYDRGELRRHGIFPLTVLARRQAVLDAGGFRDDKYEDWSLWNRMADQGARFVVVPKETWTYRTVTADRRTPQLVSA